MKKQYANYAVDKAVALLAIDSPTGYTDSAAQWIKAEFDALGFEASITTKGGVLVDLGGGLDCCERTGAEKASAGTEACCEQPEAEGLGGFGKTDTAAKGGILLEAHTDTLGAMVAEIKGDGRLRLTALGGLNACNTETENARLYTRGGKVLEGTIQLANASIHVNDEFSKTERSFDTVELVLDEDVKNAEDVRRLGVETGDIVCPDPRTRITDSGYIKSRFLDDKLSVAILLGLAKYMKDTGKRPSVKTWAHVTVYEEVGHGGAAPIPEGISEALSVDMGCVGEGLACTEKLVSICAKDSGGPYSYQMVGKLIDAAKKMKAGYAVDVYPHYGSDVECSLRSGADVRHGLIGPGVYASHGYERSHKEGVLNTLKLLEGYLELA